jgi:hypothetical protein
MLRNITSTSSKGQEKQRINKSNFHSQNFTVSKGIEESLIAYDEEILSTSTQASSIYTRDTSI